jgi:hypothetical protein
MATLQTGQVTNVTTAVPLVTVDFPVRDVLVSATVAAVIGGVGVTPSTGFPIPAATAVLVPAGGYDPPFTIYAAASAASTVSFAYVA